MNNLEEILKEKITKENSVGGGCIADARIIQMEYGKKYFVKSYSECNSIILQNEANGLKELKKANAIRIPNVIHCDEEFLILEYIKTGKRSKNFSENFGRQFAKLHKYSSHLFGFFENNFIGSNSQINNPANTNWAEFYWQNRLLFQFKLAEKNGYVDSSFKDLFTKFEKTFSKIIEGSEEKPSLLHGDLWSGNFMVDENGEPVLIDPAVYYGHREADLGMTKLFGGFQPEFYHSYNEEFPLKEGWLFRNNIYVLYHVMNHLNLFGRSYLGQVISIIRSYI